jgi:integrase/recombinase XerD
MVGLCHSERAAGLCASTFAIWLRRDFPSLASRPNPSPPHTVPPDFLSRLRLVHDLDTVHQDDDRGLGVRLWPWSRTTAWRRVSEVMEAAGLGGIHATPKGLRHGVGIKAVTSEVPLHMTQKWLGHSRIATTAIYTNATGPEEKQIAERMWL